MKRKDLIIDFDRYEQEISDAKSEGWTKGLRDAAKLLDTRHLSRDSILKELESWAGGAELAKALKLWIL